MTRSADVHLALADTTLYALDRGDGPPLLFFHGGLADHRGALLHVGGLADRLRVITPDLRGAGRSRWAGDLDWQRLADDAAALVRHLGLDRVVVGGVSMGSAVALRTALSHADVVAGLVLVHPVYPGADRPLADAVVAATAAMDAAGRRALVDGIAALYPLLDGLPDAIRARARALVDTFDRASVAATTRFLASGVQPFALADALAVVRCPALVIPGIDPTHPADVAAHLAAHLPNAELRADADVADAIARFCEAVA